ncbi:CHASE2 domain-containing protein [Melittangium boletus]|uniref:CHASE2 domain-containing protein n=1 Tax=Melittangium boletus TaxID=83453 RepID=UPI0026A66AC9
MTSDSGELLRRRLRNHLPRMLAIAVLSTTVAAVLWTRGWLGLPGLERILYDSALTRFTPQRGQSSDIVVVAIDQPSLDGVRNTPAYARDFGHFPWAPALWAGVLRELSQQGVRAVLFDRVMDETSAMAGVDPTLAQAVRDTGMPVYLGISIHPSAPPLPRVEPLHTPRAPGAPAPP